MGPTLEPKYAEINAITANWQQGDCFVGQSEFTFKANPGHHIASPESLDADEDLYTQEIVGFCIISQTCDIVRCCKERPYLEISPIVEVSNEVLGDIERGSRPNYGYIPNLKEVRTVAHLDRVMTIEKSVVKGLNRTAGCNSDAERRSFAKALGRKRTRFAFPDDFVGVVDKLRKRLIEKHDKQSDEGKALRSLREIRVAASPSWGSAEIDLNFYFIKAESAETFEGKKWTELKESWMKILVPHSRYKNIFGEVITLEIMSAKDYVESDQLDLDHLSG